METFIPGREFFAIFWLPSGICITVVEFIETTTFSVAVISTSGSMSATLITFGTAPLCDFSTILFLPQQHEPQDLLRRQEPRQQQRIFSFLRFL